MNVKNVYLCRIFIITKKLYRDELYMESRYIKSTIVVPLGDDKYRDLLSGEEYFVGTNTFRDKVGTFYINEEYGLEPFSEVIPTIKSNISKKRIIKKYKEHKNVK